MIRDLSLNPWWAEGELLRSRTSIEKIIADSARMGVDGIDMQEIYLRLSPHPDPNAVNELRTLTKNAGLSVLSCWFYADLLSASRLLSEDAAVAHVKRYLLIAASFSSRYLVLQNGDLYNGLSEAAGRDCLLRIYEAVEPLAEELGVTISMEAARAGSVFSSPAGAARLVRDFGSPRVTLAPDFEAWRLPNPDMPTTYAEDPDARMTDPASIEEFIEYLPISPFVHAKFLDIDETGTDPNYPMKELFTALQESPLEHDLSIEYEGWIPDVHPEKDPYTQTGAAVAYAKGFQGKQK